VDGRGAVGLDGLEEGVVAAGSDGTEEHEQEVVVDVLVEDEGGAEGDEGGDEDGEGEFEGRVVAVEHGEEGEVVEGHVDGESGG